MDVDLVDPTVLSSVLLSIGNGADLLTLEASGPGDFAVALFEFGKGIPGSSIGLTVLSFAVSSDTLSLADAISVLQFDPSSGFASAAALETYLESPTNDFFTFDAGLHRLTQNEPVPLLQIDLSSGSSTTRVVFNTEAIAGTVPAPATLWLLSGGCLVAFAMGRSRRRAA